MMRIQMIKNHIDMLEIKIENYYISTGNTHALTRCANYDCPLSNDDKFDNVDEKVVDEE